MIYSFAADNIDQWYFVTMNLGLSNIQIVSKIF